MIFLRDSICLTVLALILSGCFGGDSLTKEQKLTGAAAPAETVDSIAKRQKDIIARANSLIGSSAIFESDNPQLPASVPVTCSGVNCDVSGILTVSVSDITGIDSDDSAVLSKHGLTTLSATVNNGSYYGVWMDDSAFAVTTLKRTVLGADATVRFGAAGGELTGSSPSDSATWTGLMVGTPIAGDDLGDTLQGDARLSYDMSGGTIDAAFTDIKNLDDLRAHTVTKFSFDGVPVTATGTFAAGVPTNLISGAFYGAGHGETAGVFERGGIVGAFGGKMDN